MQQEHEVTYVHLLIEVKQHRNVTYIIESEGNQQHFEVVVQSTGRRQLRRMSFKHMRLEVAVRHSQSEGNSEVGTI